MLDLPSDDPYTLSDVEFAKSVAVIGSELRDQGVQTCLGGIDVRRLLPA